MDVGDSLCWAGRGLEVGAEVGARFAGGFYSGLSSAL